MKNLIAFNFFLFMICFGFNANAACEAGQMTELLNTQEVGRKNMKTGIVTLTKLPAGSEVHVTTIENDEASIYAMRDANGNFIGAMATLDLKNVIALACQGS